MASAESQYYGGIQTYLNATSLQRLADDFAIIVPDFIAREENFTFDIDLQKTFLYDLKLNDIKVLSMSVPNRTVKIIPGAKYPTFVAEFAHVDFVGHVTGGMEVGKLQIFNFTELRIEGLKMRIEFGIVREGNSSIWQLHSASVVDFKDIRVVTDSVVFNSALEVFHQVLMMYLRAEENGF